MKGWSNWSPILSKRLQDEGKSASRHRVAKLMRDNGWHAKVATYVSVIYEQDQWLASFKNEHLKETNLYCLFK